MPSFDPNSLPKRSGVYTRTEAEGQEVVLPSVGGTVCVPITHDWGPAEEPTLCTSLADFQRQFGDSYSDGYVAVRNAFYGEGLPGRGGAGAVLAYRMVGSSGAKARRTLQHTGAASAIHLDARYEGSKGSELKVTVQDYPADAAKDELILYLDTVEVERYTYANDDIADLVAQINAQSAWITATEVATGTALTPVSSVGFTTTAGDDGATLVAGDWTDALTALDAERFSIIAPVDLTDSGILASLKTWVQSLNLIGRRVMAVVGGDTDETVATAVTRSTSLNSENFVNLGVGSYYDDNIIDPATGEAVVLSSSQLASRIAGILAQRGDGGSATYARLVGLRIKVGPTNANIETAHDGGVLVLARDGDPVAPVHLERALTTYTTKTDAAKPYLIYRNPKFVRTMHLFEESLQEWQASSSANIIGNASVNDKTRRSVVAEAKARLAALVRRDVIQPEPTVHPSTSPAPSDYDEFVAITYGMAFGRSVEQVLNTIRFS